MTDATERGELRHASSHVDEGLDVHRATVGGPNNYVKPLVVPMFCDSTPNLPAPAKVVAMVNHAQNFGRLIRSLRRQRRLTQVEFAVEIGVSRSTVAGIEAGHYMPGRDTLLALADFFGVPVEQLRHGIAGPGAPRPPQVIDDPDEAAWVDFWRGLSDYQRRVITQALRVPHRNNDAA